jgi:hypothetical protein
MGRILAVGTTHAVLVSTSDGAALGTIWKFWTQFTNLRGHANIELGARMARRTVKTARRIVSVALLALLASGTFGNAQQTTGQLLISSGFNPIAATTPAMMARLMSFPANQFVLRQKGGRPYYVYADPAACTCAYVGSVAATDKYRASFGTLPADALSSGSFTDPEQNMINSMESDDAGAQFSNDVFGPDF